MAGPVTGWVLRHGPKDRCMKAVLVTIADAAPGRDGSNAHPGLNAIIEGSGYSRRSVLQALARLEQDGWIETTERGGGRGKATVYRVVMEPRETVQPSRERVQQATLFPDGNGAVQREKRCSPARETVQSTDSAPHIATVSNEQPNLVPPPSAPARETGRRRDPLFDAVAAVCGIDPSELTPSARGAMNRALGELRAIGADPGDVPSRAAAYRAKFTDAVLTPNALAKHWPNLRPELLPATAAGPRRGSVGDDSLAAGARWLERQAARR